MFFRSIVASSNDSSNSLFNILLNFFVFITFQFRLRRRIDFVYVLRFSIILIDKFFDKFFYFLVYVAIY